MWSFIQQYKKNKKLFFDLQKINLLLIVIQKYTLILYWSGLHYGSFWESCYRSVFDQLVLITMNR